MNSTTDRPRLSRKLLVPLLAGMTMVGALSTDAYLPSFNAIAAEFGVGLDLVQQTLTVYLLATAVMMLFHGTVSDSVGRVPVVMWSLGVYLVGSIGAVFAPNLEVLLVCRGLQGLSAGAGAVVGRAMVRDLFEGAEAQRVMSYVTVVFGLAPVVAPLAGGWLEVTFGWRSVFVFLTLYAALIMATCGVYLRESLPVQERAPLHIGSTFRDYGRALSNGRFVLQSLAIALATSIIFIYVSSAPAFIMGLLHLPETAFSWLFLPLITGIMGGSVMSGALAHRWTGRKIIAAGYALLLVSCTGNVVYCALATPNVPWAVLPLLMGCFGFALSTPAMTLQTLDLFSERRGMASSLQSAILMASFGLYAGWLVPLIFHSALYLALAVTVCSVMSVVLWTLAHRGRPYPRGTALALGTVLATSISSS